MRAFLFFSALLFSFLTICDTENGLDHLEDSDWNMDNLDFVAKTKKKNSHLGIVYNRLAILTRITNAIALQSEAIRKSVRVRDVIAELLRSPPKHLNNLLAIDPLSLLPILEDNLKASLEIQKFSSEMKELNGKREILELMNVSMRYVKGQQINETKMEIFFGSLQDGSFQKTVESCEDWILDSVIKFEKDSGILDSQKILKCLESLKSYDTKIEKVLEQFQLFIQLGEAKEGIQKFNNLSEEALEYPKIVDSVMKLFEKTDKFRRRQKGPELGSEIYLATIEIGKIQSQEPELSLTLGFPDSGDMAKVLGDLKSPWFLEKVARNHSVAELGKGLFGFFKFGKLMKKVEDNWEMLKTNYKEFQNNIIVFSKKMKDIESFKITENDLKVAESSGEIFQKTWSPPDKIGALDFKNLDEILSKMGKLIEKVQFVKNLAKEIAENTEKVGIESFFKELKSGKPINSLPNFHTFKDLAERFRKLKIGQDELKNFKFGANLRKTSTLIQKLKDSKLKSNLENLKSYGEEFQPELVLKMMKFCKTVFSLSNFKETKIFLQIFAALKHGLLEAEQFVKDIGPQYHREHSGKEDSNPILKLENSQEMALSLGRGMRVLRQMVKTLRYKRRLRKVLEYSEGVHDKIQRYNAFEHVREIWRNRKMEISKLLSELENLNKYAEKVQDSSPMEMRKILDEATKVHGFSSIFGPIFEQFKGQKSFLRETRNFEKLSELELNFASHKGYLHAASLSFDELKQYFDEVFDLDHNRHHHHEIEHNHLPAIFICITIFILIILSVFIIYGFTPTGRIKYTNLYLYYFGKPEAFEKRWRYSLFMDRQDGKNALLDAAREINPTNLRKVLKKGAYINAYNKFGNTSLHLATKRGHPEIVEILIQNGADRTLLNAYNKTAEQMIPSNYRATHPEKISRFKKIEKIYEKFKNKKFRNRVPSKFPLDSYHIFIEDRTDDKVTEKFMEQFQSITTDEATVTTTHFVVRTEKDGVFSTDSLDLLVWILSGVIIVKDTWMTECLKNPKQICNEWAFLVEKIRYKGTVYDTVPQWQQAMAKATMPYLCGVYVAVVIQDYANLISLASIVATHGGVICEKFPEKQNFNSGFRPYLHVETGPFFVIHDGKIDLGVYKNDPDGMYTVMTETEFVHFMLGRKIKRNKSHNPIPALNDLED
ncbi:hypothetical protein B9Z55_011417 [Caenorhabditis nigoni]|uniref:BRCT domain-containing protein n=1 Tax=Caenorhabditis nigoni TaxID=1611254 RepID=A0A2G5UJX6_9PELO|nr:hypothetical protein B9Z55_011417 [Caenorhabditis nigoni]